MIEERAFTRLAGCEDIGQTLSCFQRTIENEGFCSYSYVDVGDVYAQQQTDPYFETTVRSDFINSYVSQGFLEHDPVVLRSWTAQNPFSWYDCAAFRVAKRYTRGHKNYSRKILELAYDHDFKDGIIIPIHNVDRLGNKRSALVSLYYSRAEKADSACRPLNAPTRLLSMYLHEKIIGLNKPSSTDDDFWKEDRVLSDRQREILTWVARGKTSDEISTILNITTPTVEHHLREAFAILGVYSRAHAVALSISKGLIVI